MSLRSLPTDEQFLSALQAYRQRWPGDGYLNTRHRFLEMYRLLRQSYSGGRVVEIGGWPGDFCCTLASLGFDMLAIDKDPARKTSNLGSQSGPGAAADSALSLAGKFEAYGVPVVTCDIERERLPFGDGEINFFLLTDVVAHLRVGLLHALREILRSLHADGRGVITTPNLLSLRNRISFLTGSCRYDTMELPYDALDRERRIGHGGIFRTFSMAELTDLLTRVGFRILQRGYRQLRSVSEEDMGWSFYALRQRSKDWIAQAVPPLRNGLFLVVGR